MGCILCQDSCCLGHDNSFSVKHIQRESPISFQVLPRNSIPSIQELTDALSPLPKVTNEQEESTNKAQASYQEENNLIVNTNNMDELPEMLLQQNPEMNNIQVYERGFFHYKKMR